MKLTPLSKVLIVLAVAGVGFGVYKKFGDQLAPPAPTKPSVDVPKADLPPLQDGAGNQVPAAALPGMEPGCADKPEVRAYIWAWNSQMGWMFANGGPQATKGSLMCEKGVNLKLIREDMVDKMQEGMVAFATELSKGNPNPTVGTHFVAIMGDGGASFLKGLNDALMRIGPEYTAKVVGSAGFSRGEDKFMGPPAWKKNPQASRGGLVAGYLRDGDWNIAQKWLGDNGLCNNPDEKTWDPNCLNWVNASDYIDAGEKYIAGYCEDRPVVSKGKKTGETKKVCVNGVVTWTPGDVNVAKKKGGLVSIVSTKEYSAQMPNTIIGIDKWMKANRSTVESMLSAIFAGGDQVKYNAQAFDKAAEVSAVVYKEQDAAYWKKYFRGVVEKDAQGLDVELGGSSVNNLADNLNLFGLTPGSANLFAATYEVFGKIASSQYPELMPNFPPTKDILDTSYIQAISSGAAPTTQAELPKFTKEEKIATQISRKAWNITFESGKAVFTPEAERDLNKLLDDLLVAGSTIVEIHGHTDNMGDPNANMSLSEQRAFAVKTFLEGKSPVNFPEGRLRVFAHGQTNPVVPNDSAPGRAKNRRVEIVIGTAE